MNQQLEREVRDLGGDPTDATWRWFLLNGPHGPRFTWGQSRREPAGYVGVEHLQRVVAEKTLSDPGFGARARRVVQAAFNSHKPMFLRRAIQITAVIGGPDDEPMVASFVSHPDRAVAADASACLFLLNRRAG